ncbi:MAG: Rha family transcriptional regulator [Bacteroidales bacterium]
MTMIANIDHATLAPVTSYVFNKGGQVLTDTLKVAEFFGKSHKNILRDIDNLGCSQDFGKLNFELSSYKTTQNKNLPLVEMTKDGFLFLAMGYTGAAAALIKERYISEFNRMEKELQAQPVMALPNFNNPVEAARAWADAKEGEMIALADLAEAAPKVDFVDRYVETEELMGFRELSKLLQIGERAFRKFLVENEVMYKLGSKWVGTAYSMDRGYFKCEVGVTYEGQSYSNCKFTTKGVVWIAGKLRDAGLLVI